MTRFSGILHGADYNPDQWQKYPEIIDRDFELLKAARMNSITVGVFAWAALEPEEGCYTFGWLDDIFERAERQGIRVILATPSGGKPNWLARAHPEVRRVKADGSRDPQYWRHNHCLTSPIYREKVAAINLQLARRYGRHPNLELWHLSNEYSGYCYCDLCKAAFRKWLRERYRSLDALNEAYWAHFWGHTFTDWEEIDFIDSSIHGLELDWKRFMTSQCASFMRLEAEPIRLHSPGVPVTTNFMYLYPGYNYWELAREVDIVSWDSYPSWHLGNEEMDESREGATIAFHHDVYRSMKRGKSFLLMETTPSQINHSEVSPLRRPGIHRLSSLQAVAHGSDSVCYFQFRKGRGSLEKFHGAVVDHLGDESPRVFRDVASLGETLGRISGVAGGETQAKVALIYDWENRWAIEQSRSPQNAHKEYLETCIANYLPFWKRGISVDVIDSEADLGGYSVVVVPMLHMIREGQTARFEKFVKYGGVLVATYHTGVVNETDLCFPGGAPGPLRGLLGILVEEFDALPDKRRRVVAPMADAGHGLDGTYQARHYVELIRAESARVLATYGDDFYAGYPSLTVNRFGDGRAYYIASRNDDRFQDDFFGSLASDLCLPRALEASLPPGVSASARWRGTRKYVFLLNFTAVSVAVEIPSEAYEDAETGEACCTPLQLASYGSRVLRQISPELSGS
jgi:beta-galactosidase